MMISRKIRQRHQRDPDDLDLSIALSTICAQTSTALKLEFSRYEESLSKMNVIGLQKTLKLLLSLDEETYMKLKPNLFKVFDRYCLPSSQVMKVVSDFVMKLLFLGDKEELDEDILSTFKLTANIHERYACWETLQVERLENSKASKKVFFKGIS